MVSAEVKLYFIVDVVVIRTQQTYTFQMAKARTNEAE